MLFLCVSVYCHRVTTQLQLINIIIIIIILLFFSGANILRLWFVTKVLVIHQLFIPRNVIVERNLLSGLRPLLIFLHK